MVCFNRHLTVNKQQLIGLALQVSEAALYHFSHPLSQSNKEGVYFLSHFGGVAKAGVGHNFFPNPIPDGLIRVEIGIIVIIH